MRFGSASRRTRRLVKAGAAAAAAAATASAIFASQAHASPYNFGSGYSAINGTYTSVTANWIQPTATCNGGNQQTGFWVGLSGVGTIAQTGTAANCNGTTPVYYTWWEMFPAAGVPISAPTVPGDHIHASVTYDGDNKFTLTVKNVTRGWTMTQYKTQNPSGGTPISANVIVEANADNGPHGNVTNFGSINFGGVTANGKPIRDFPLWTGNLANLGGVQEDTVSPLVHGGRQFTATWNSTG